MAESDFMDFNAWNDLAAASEEEVLQRQQADFQTQTQAANSALSRAQLDAQRTHAREAQGAGIATTTLSNVGSYGDYLKAKQNAQNAAMRLAGGNSGELGDVRRRTNANGGYNTNAINQTAALNRREQLVGEDDDARLVSENMYADARRGREKAASDEMAARRSQGEADNLRFRKYYESLIKGTKEFAGGGSPGDYEQASRGYLATMQGGYDNEGFDPESKWGRETRGSAYGSSSLAGPNQVFATERRWGNYGRK